MLIQKMIEYSTFRYSLEPGDGSQYRFSFMQMETGFASGYHMKTEPNGNIVNGHKTQIVHPGSKGVLDLVSHFEPGTVGSNYLEVIVYGGGENKSFYIQAQHIDTMNSTVINSISSEHKIPKGSLIAILLAIKILRKDPTLIEPALANMLHAQDYLGKGK